MFRPDTTASTAVSDACSGSFFPPIHFAGDEQSSPIKDSASAEILENPGPFGRPAFLYGILDHREDRDVHNARA